MSSTTSTVDLAFTDDELESSDFIPWYKQRKFQIIAGAGLCVACISAIAIPLIISSSSSTPEATQRAAVPMPKNLALWTNLAWGYKDEVQSDHYIVSVDMFDKSESYIQDLHDDGHWVLCYISVGTIESWRPDANDFPSNCKGLDMADWEGETWFKMTDQSCWPLMESRFKMARDKGCDGIEMDNMDCYVNKCISGKDSSDLKQPQIDYSKFLAETAHDYGMGAGQKNVPALVDSLVNTFDLAVLEECNDYNECGYYNSFRDQNKAIVGVEYKSSSDNAGCSSAASTYGQSRKYQGKKNGESVWKDC
ncbi:hypothetical protein SARC_01808 [Sphaeroforma arctica JP610]|uniref:Glycoside-hydrolase family GH114 TIM-barrel domain-containing protein n=1 Tax=Sphaeroforma arctica JP610 TaxID=667725 RepID=A0A0L0GAE9_9EUKA|nr:hypothetical protein SARC_01808 [Sphaeroforma arctica JP610]KNC86007.1 hypothetical protein SARC_01808 [Sphaeroforma arctica JP610]|eukprot:XP_014159909.1 hypothetical protein SARC_01808 [Sphaeroforma arctica JP610]